MDLWVTGGAVTREGVVRESPDEGTSMSNDDIAERTCQYPDCNRPRRPGSGRGRPPQYCDLPEHSPLKALRERQRRVTVGATGSTATATEPEVPAPRDPEDPLDSGRVGEVLESDDDESSEEDAAATAEEIAEELVAVTGRARALVEHLDAARAKIAELTARAESAEDRIERQREYYEARLLLLGELPRTQPPR